MSSPVLDKNETCSLLGREQLPLPSKALCYINILGKITSTKGISVSACKVNRKREIPENCLSTPRKRSVTKCSLLLSQYIWAIQTAIVKCKNMNEEFSKTFIKKTKSQ